jgi:hypothetical protein
MVAATAPLYRARTAVSLAELDAEIARARTLINSAREMRRELDRLSLADTAVHAENAP